MKLRGALLYVKDLEKMAAFYRDGLELGLVPGAARDGWAELDAGSASLALHAIPAQIASAIVIGDPPRRRSETPLKLIFEVGDLDGARTRLAARGAAMGEPTAWRSCDGVDPEGNVFQLVEVKRAALGR